MKENNGKYNKNLAEWKIVLITKWGKPSIKTQIILAVALVVLVFYGGVKYQEMRLTLQSENNEIILEAQIPAEQEEKEEEPPPQTLTVHVAGAVEKPGVYILEEGSRVNDAVQMAVPLAKADLTQVNLAAPLSDGRQIFIPLIGQKPAAVSVGNGGTAVGGTVNINTAGVKELDTLPGIGPVLAQRIVEYRETKGSFKNVEELTKVSGIGPALLAKIKDRVRAD